MCGVQSYITCISLHLLIYTKPDRLAILLWKGHQEREKKTALCSYENTGRSLLPGHGWRKKSIIKNDAKWN